MSTGKSTFHERLGAVLTKAGTALCVGLDPDVALLPEGYSPDLQGLEEHMADVIVATSDVCAAYKINTAFFEAHGAAGWSAMERTLKRVRDRTDVPVIADAKRGDLENTARFYAKAFFEQLGFDAVTLQPYMGYDSLAPFLEYSDRGSIVLCLTSNAGSADFQQYGDGAPLFLEVARRCAEWDRGNVMLVVGATRNPDDMRRIREVAPALPFLVPGVGRQGGDFQAVLSACGPRLLVNASRSIACASTVRGELRDAARSEALRMQSEYHAFLDRSKS